MFVAVACANSQRLRCVSIFDLDRILGSRAGRKFKGRAHAIRGHQVGSGSGRGEGRQPQQGGGRRGGERGVRRDRQATSPRATASPWSASAPSCRASARRAPDAARPTARRSRSTPRPSRRSPPGQGSRKPSAKTSAERFASAALCFFGYCKAMDWQNRGAEPSHGQAPHPFAGQPRRAAPLDQLAAGLLLLREESGRLDPGRGDLHLLRRHLAPDRRALEHHRALDHRHQGQGAGGQGLQPGAAAQQPRAVPARPPHVRLLRRRVQLLPPDARPHHAAVARRARHLDERGHRLPAVQRPQAQPPARGMRAWSCSTRRTCRTRPST